MFPGTFPKQKSKGIQQKTMIKGQIMFLGRGGPLPPPQEHSFIVPGPSLLPLKAWLAFGMPQT